MIKRYLIFFLVFFIYLVPRLLNIGGDIYNFDADLWFPRGENFVRAILAGNFEQTYQQYHPGVTLMWIIGIPLEIFNYLFEARFGHASDLYANHFYYRQFVALFPLMIVISAIGTAIFYYLRKITNIKYALIFSIFLSIEPFFLGITRFVHVTGLLAMFSFLSTIILLYYLKENKAKDLYIYSVVIGLALLTKVNAIVFFGLNSLLLVTYLYFYNIKNDKEILTTMIKSLIITITTYVLLWPAMWVNPFKTVQRIYKNGIAKTAIEDNEFTPIKSILEIKYLYYTEINLYRLSSFLTILLIAGIILYIIKRKEINNYLSNHIWLRNTLILAIIYYVVYYVALSVPTKLKDRYITVYIPYLVLITSFVYYYLIINVNKITQKIMLTLTVIYFCFISWVNFPVYSFYYSELVGGANGLTRLGYNVINRGEYFIPVADYVNSKEGVNPENLNIIVYGGTYEKTIKPAIKSKVLNKAGFLSDNENGDYWLSLYRHLDYVPYDYCKLEKTFGPRDPLHFPALSLFKCEGLDNTYRDPKAD